MQETPFTQFLDLIQLDQRIEARNKECQKFIKQLKELQEQDKVQSDAVQLLKHETAHAQKAVDAFELEMKTLDAAEKEKKHRLDNVTNHKEYQSLKHEIDELKKKQHALEEELLAAWHKLEQKKSLLQEKQDTFNKMHGEIQERIAAITQQHDVCKLEVDTLVAQRPAKEEGVPAEWLDKYLMMRAQVPDPVVPVINGSCSACFYKVNEQDLLLLKHKKLLQCKDCYRFLYLPTPGNES